MRTPEEIERAHEIIRRTVLHVRSRKLPLETMALDVLSWVLGREENTAFDAALDKLEAAYQKLDKMVEKLDNSRIN